MSGIVTLLCVVIVFILGICIAQDWLVVNTSSAAKRKQKGGAAQAYFDEVARHCRHSSVPWPVMSGGDLVAWLCAECNEQRKVFTCPPPAKPRVLCDHEEMQELRTFDSSTVQRWCTRCGYRDRVQVKHAYNLTPRVSHDEVMQLLHDHINCNAHEQRWNL